MLQLSKRFFLKGSITEKIIPSLFFCHFSTNSENQNNNVTLKKSDRFSLSPHSFWLTQGKGTERPFTGIYHDTKEVGHYECIVCSKKLFMSEHKFFPPTGMASFWTHVPNSIELIDDIDGVQENLQNIISIKYNKANEKKQRCQCSACKSHLGLVYLDGPPPTFLRFSINSGSLSFVEKPFFEDPKILRDKKKEEFLKAQQEKKKTLERLSLNRKNVYDIVEKIEKKDKDNEAGKNKIKENQKK